MKTMLLLLLSCSCVFAMGGLAEGWLPPGPASLEGAYETPGLVIETGVQCSKPCRLVVMPTEYTVVDRGLTEGLDETRVFEGTFRYWREPTGCVLYVYDEARALVARVVNPDSVTVVEVLETKA
jgi:hypothetical protein